jgi:hypothetical protein
VHAASRRIVTGSENRNRMLTLVIGVMRVDVTRGRPSMVIDCNRGGGLEQITVGTFEIGEAVAT